MSGTGGRENPSSDRAMRTMLGVCTLIITLTALYFARSIFAPLAFALFIVALIWPVQSRLQSRMLKLVALATSILVTILVFTAFGSLITWSFARVGQYVVGDAARFQSHYTQLANWLEGHGIALASVWAEHFNVSWLIRLFQEITTRLNSILTFSIVVLIYLMLGLVEVDAAVGKLRALENVELGRILMLAGAKTAAKYRRYMLVRTLMSATTGLLVWAFASAVGLQLAVEWGVIAFLLNYVPIIGPLAATVFPTLFAVAQFETLQTAAVVFGCLILIQFVVGSYLEPRIAGGALSLSPFLVLFAVFFWTFLWGIAGAFIGVPIVIAAMTICEQHPSSRWVADLFGGGATKHE